MKAIITGAIASLLTGLPFNIQAHSKGNEALYFIKPDTPEIMVHTKQQAPAPALAPYVELGDISMRNGIRGRNIKLFGSSSLLPGLDQALSGCDGHQATAWVSYENMTITCYQRGVEVARSVPLPSFYRKALLTMLSKGLNSQILITHSTGDGVRPVIDDTILETVAETLWSMQFNNPFASMPNSTYGIRSTRYENHNGLKRLIVDLCVVGDSDLNQPAMDGNLPSCLGRGKGSRSHGASKKSGESSGRRNNQDPEETPPSQPPGGAGDGDGDDPDKNKKRGKKPAEILKVMGMTVDIDAIFKALKELSNLANDEQQELLNGSLEQITELIFLHPSSPLATSDDYDVNNIDDNNLTNPTYIMRMLIIESINSFKSIASNHVVAKTILRALKAMLEGVHAGHTTEQILQALQGLQIQQILQESVAENAVLAQDDQGASATATAGTDDYLNGVLNCWSKMILVFLDIKIDPEKL